MSKRVKPTNLAIGGDDKIGFDSEASTPTGAGMSFGGISPIKRREDETKEDDWGVNPFASDDEEGNNLPEFSDFRVIGNEDDAWKNPFASDDEDKDSSTDNSPLNRSFSAPDLLGELGPDQDSSILSPLKNLDLGLNQSRSVGNLSQSPSLLERRRKGKRTNSNLSLSLSGLTEIDSEKSKKSQKKQEKQKEERETARKKAIDAIIDEDEIVFHSFYDQTEDDLRVFNESYTSLTEDKKREKLAQLIGKGAAATNNVNLVLSKKASIEKIREVHGDENGENYAYSFYNKDAGKNKGFIISVKSQEGTEIARYYAKEFMDTKTSTKKKINEFFIYKVLQNLGFGPKAYFACCDANSPTIITEGLGKTKKVKIDQETVKVFKTYSEIKEDESWLKLGKEGQEKYKRFCRDVIALELTASILKLSDVKDNYGNSGIVHSAGPKGEKSKAKIVDFSSDPKPAEISENLPKFDELKEMINKEEAGNALLCALPFTHYAKGADLEDYQNAVRSLLQGRDLTREGSRRPSLEEAVQMALKSCEEVNKIMHNLNPNISQKRNDFDLDVSLGNSSSSSNSSSGRSSAESLKQQNEALENRLGGLRGFAELVKKRTDDLQGLLNSPSPTSFDKVEKKEVVNSWVV